MNRASLHTRRELFRRPRVVAHFEIYSGVASLKYFFKNKYKNKNPQLSPSSPMCSPELT